MTGNVLRTFSYWSKPGGSQLHKHIARKRALETAEQMYIVFKNNKDYKEIKLIENKPDQCYTITGRLIKKTQKKKRVKK
jgi:hypothetical protein